jgi:hypothetical protein
MNAGQIEDYTTLKLCPSAAVHDLTSKEERDGIVGFAFHARLELTDQCRASFEREVAMLSAQTCPEDRLRSEGCHFELGDTGSKRSSHTSIMVTPTGTDGYDLRFWK